MSASTREIIDKLNDESKNKDEKIESLKIKLTQGKSSTGMRGQLSVSSRKTIERKPPPEGIEYQFGYDEERKLWGYLLVPLPQQAYESTSADKPDCEKLVK